MPVWPITLPPSARWGWTMTPIPNVIASGVQSRRQYTKPIRTYQVSTVLTSAQFEEFLIFWETGIKSGADKFTWERPNTPGVPQDFKPLPGTTYNAQHLEAGVYTVSLSLMEVP